MNRFAFVAALILALPAWAVDEPADYRDDNYREPVPATLAGA